MAAKLLICVSADQTTAAIWQGRRLGSIRQFENTEEGWVSFAQYLRTSARGLPARIMVDSIDEDYRFETMPHVSGRDRGEMVNRKLRQLYRSTPYCAWTLEERGTGKRGDDRYLFTALTNPELLAPLSRVLDSQRVPVSGIHTVPLVTLSLIERLKLSQSNLLIVTRNGAGLRQTFCKHLKYRISRLTPPVSANDAAMAFYAEEINSTRMYLDALTVTHVDDAVTVLVLDHDGSLAELGDAISRGRPNMHCVRLSPADIVSRLGIAAEDLSASPDALHLHLLGTTSPRINLAPPTVGTRFNIYRARQLVYASSGVVALAALMWAAYGVFQFSRTDDLVAEQIREANQFQRMYSDVTAHFPATPVSADELRQSVEIAERIRTNLRTPRTMLSIVSRALDDSPEIALQRIDWRYGVADTILPRSSEAQPATATPSTTAAAAVEIGIISAEVKNHEGDQRGVLARIREFTARLAASGQVAEVRVLRLPVDLNPETGLSGSTLGGSKGSDSQFGVAVAFRPGV